MQNVDNILETFPKGINYKDFHEMCHDNQDIILQHKKEVLAISDVEEYDKIFKEGIKDGYIRKGLLSYIKKHLDDDGSFLKHLVFLVGQYKN